MPSLQLTFRRPAGFFTDLFTAAHTPQLQGLTVVQERLGC